MPVIGTSPHSFRYDLASDPKARQEKRQAERDTAQLNSEIPVFMFQGFGFRPQYRVMRGNLYLEGPLCPRTNTHGEQCFTVLSAPGQDGELKVVCDVCGFSGNLPRPYEEFRQVAHKKYEGYRRFIESGGKVETLDVPYEAIKQIGKDETREIKVNWSQKDGRKMAVIYFIEKDANGDKAQIMVDMDREEIRYDPSDIPPGKILAKIKAEFPKSEIDVTYKGNK